MNNFEKLGFFYLGKQYDLAQQCIKDETVLYDSKDLTTHAVCVGMTGSGKTGLCISLLEEAAIDGIPTVAIDPKGDLGNLKLTFPKLRPTDFAPWIDPGEAARKGLDVDAYARKVATVWSKGLAEWGQDGERIAAFRQAAEVSIYTPGSSAGLPISLLRSFDVPPAAILEDGDAFRERVNTTVSGLLALLGIQADPLRDREHILLANILHHAWQKHGSLDLPGLIRQIQDPPFDQLGVFDLESFYPSKARFELAMGLNNLLASPGFSAWMEGEPLDIGRLLYTAEGRPRISILSIAHLSDRERMFFVTMILNELLSWTRSQPGSPSLRALLYMDEILGYFPPTAMPPSKPPMLALLKQARAFGVGVVLATQNPVDLDYKGLSNAGTWFLGRLQTEQDKNRVLDGLQGIGAGGLSRKEMGAALSWLGKRVFLMHNVHEDGPIFFNTRWALSYLRGPLTRAQIQELTPSRGDTSVEGTATAPENEAPASTVPLLPTSDTFDRPILPPGVEEVFLPLERGKDAAATLLYRPGILATIKLHYVSATAKVDEWQALSLWLPLADEGEIDWDQASTLATDLELSSDPCLEDAHFASLPPAAMQVKNFRAWAKSLTSYLYQSRKLERWKCKDLKAVSSPDETEGDFRGRLTHLAREKRDLQVEKLRARHGKSLASLEDRIRRAQEKVGRERSQYQQAKLQTTISVGATLAGMVFGRKLSSVRNVGRATTAARGASRASQQKADIRRAKDELEAQRAKLLKLEEKLGKDIATVERSTDPADLSLDALAIRPRKSDIAIETLALAWHPSYGEGE